MSAFRIVTHDGQCIADLGTFEHQDLLEARHNAMRITASLVTEQAASFDFGRNLIVAVTDTAGALHFRIAVAVLAEPAIPTL